jgi:glycosyltransferase involved in cell wall biosynthesis
MTHDPTSTLVSVVLPVWNGERYLSEAIDSVLSQTHRHFELIIVDDGSDDRSREIIACSAKRDARVQPIYAAHRGLVPTLNAGGDAAQGKYIARLDYDDIALPGRLEQQVRFLEDHPAVALVATAYQCIDAAGQRRPIVNKPPADNDSARKRLGVGNPFCHSTVMMRRDVFAQLGGYRPLFAEAEDYDLWTRFADHHELAGIPEVLVLYRIHARQVSLTRLEQQALVALAIRVSTDRRWRTGDDPLAGCEAIDRAAVRGLGLSDEEIDSHLVHAYLRCLSMMPKLGQSKAALDALRELAAHAPLIDALEAVSVGSC